MKFKRIIISVITLIMVLTFSSCATMPTSISSAVENKYENETFSALLTDLTDKKLISKQSTKLESSIIGASEGYRFTSTSNYGTVELYYFSDTSDNEYIKDAEDGKVTFYGSEFNSVLSKNKEFLLVFSPSVNVDINSVKSEIDSEAEAEKNNNSKDSENTSSGQETYDLVKEFIKYTNK